MRLNSPKLLIIVGPTATGKTDLAITLAGKFNGEIIACDSRQIYKGLDIGSGKMPTNERSAIIQKGDGYWIVNGIKIWLYDCADPKDQYTVAEYIHDAKLAIDKVVNSGKLPVIVGGTGFYLKALLEGMVNISVPVDEKLRIELASLSLAELQNKLQKASFQKWGMMNNSDKNNPRRIIRAIELSLVKEEPKQLVNGIKDRFNILKIGLDSSRMLLYKKADERVRSRIKEGMLEEARELLKQGVSLERQKRLGLEYGVLSDYLSRVIKDIEGEHGLIKILQNKIHGYIRRQQTWFKKEKNMTWFDISKENSLAQVEKIVRKWYYPSDATKD